MEATCNVLSRDAVIKSLVSLVGVKVDRGIILWEAVRNLTVTRPADFKANPPVAIQTGSEINVEILAVIMNIRTVKMKPTQSFYGIFRKM